MDGVAEALFCAWVTELEVKVGDEGMVRDLFYPVHFAPYVKSKKGMHLTIYP